MSFLVLVGSFAPLISTLQFTVSPPSLTLISQVTSGTSPSWLLGHPVNNSIVYASDEVDDGAINSLVLDKTTGKLTPVSNISAQGAGTTHLGLVNNGTQIGAANFNGGSAFFATLESDLLHFSDPQLIKFQASGSNATSHAHEIVPFGEDVFVPDLGQNTVFRLGLENGQYAIKEAITQGIASGPRHAVAEGNTLYTLHELSSTLTQHTVTSSADGASASLIASLSIKPDDTDSTTQLAAGELIFATNPTPLLYASNRNDPNPAGDAIAIFETTPRLKRVAEVRTGLKHLRGVAFIGDDNEFLIAGGLNGGGIKVFERVSAEQGFLNEIASLPEGTVDQPTSFVGIPLSSAESVSSSLLSNPTTISSNVQPEAAQGGASRQIRFSSMLLLVSIVSLGAFL